MLVYVIALISGCLAGILGALLGVSGGIIMLPASQFLLGFSPMTAVGTSLLAGIFTISSGAYGHFRAGNVMPGSALFIGGGGLAGVLLGSYLFKAHLSNNAATLEMLLGLLFLFMAFRMGREVYREWRKKDTAELQIQGKPIRKQNLKLVLLGLFTGTMAGVFGVGGGFILVPVLIWYFGALPYTAVGTTLLAMLPYITVGGLIKLQQGFVNLPVALLLGGGAIIGAQLGVMISRRVQPLLFKLIFTLIFFYLSWQYLLP